MERGEASTLFPGYEFLGIDDGVPDVPADVFHQKILDVTYPAVSGTNMIPGDSGYTAKMWIATLG